VNPSGCTPVPQVMADYKGAAGEAKDAGDHATLQSEQAAWRERALQFLRKRGSFDTDEGGNSKLRKRYRVKAFEWCLAVDNALRVGTGRGLATFRRPADESLSPFEWPRLSLAPDQGTDGLAALSFLMYDQSINIDITPDTSHGMWRDVQLSIKRTGHWSFLLLMVASFNIVHGPFEEDRFYNVVKEAVLEYFTVADPATCPIFQHYLPYILQDRGEEERLTEEGVEAALWEDLYICYAR
jgi:hypothetical protein